MFGVVSVEEIKKEKVEALAFSQMMEQCHDQMSPKMGIKMWRPFDWRNEERTSTIAHAWQFYTLSQEIFNNGRTEENVQSS